MIRTLAAALATSTCVMALATPAAAQTREYNIPAGSLKSALDAYVRQSGRQVVYRADQVRSARSPGTRGQQSAEAALAAILVGSGFATRVDGNLVAIVRAGGNGPAAEAASSGDAVRPDQDIVVTGSRLTTGSAQFPVKAYSREEIDASGQTDIGSFLATLNEVSVTTPSAGPYAASISSTVQLRGLPVGTTLTLLNGRRLQSFGSASVTLVFDLNAIPFEAVERIDVLPVGSSAIYGGDALAGVVNVVLKRSIDGIALSMNHGFAKDTDETTASIAAGKSFSRGSLMFVGSASKTTPLYTSEREFFRDADYRRFGGVDARTLTCMPGTVSSTSSANLPGLNSTVAGIPTLPAGASPRISDFGSTAGQPNRCGQFGAAPGWSLINESKRYAAHVAGDFRLSDAITLFGEGTYSNERIHINVNPITLTNILVPASNAFNPFGVPVRVTTQLGVENGYLGRLRKSEFQRALLGARGSIADRWDFEATVMTSRDQSTSITEDNPNSTAARTAALASADPAEALNPFTTGRAASERVLRSIWSDVVSRKAKGSHDQANIFVRGSMKGLPAGRIGLVVGGEISHDSWISKSPGSNFDTRRDARAVFGEVSLPLLADRSGREILSASAAARWDSFSDYGDAATYQAGVQFSPVDGLSLRGAIATSFKPPSLLQLNSESETFTTEDFGLIDPRRGNAPVTGGTVQLGPPAALGAEKGRAAMLGAVWQPPAVPGLRLGGTAWRVKIRGLITLLFPQTILDNETLFPDLVTRGAGAGALPGPVSQVDLQYANFGLISVAGLDLDASYRFSTAIGDISLGASASRTTKYDTLLVPGAPMEDRLGVRAIDFWAPKWKGRANFSLRTGGWQFGVAGRYTGSYLDSATSNRSLGDRWLFDASARLEISPQASLNLSVVNIGNRLPEYSAASGRNFDITQGDWRGRYVNVRVSARF